MRPHIRVSNSVAVAAELASWDLYQEAADVVVEHPFAETTSPFETAANELAEWGVSFGLSFWECSPEAQAILLCEACNLAAKLFDEYFYSFKEWLIGTIVKYRPEGILIWADPSEGTVSLWHEEVGTASFHMPGWDLWELAEAIRPVPFRWSGIRRQGLAFEMLVDRGLRQHMAKATRPRSLYWHSDRLRDLAALNGDPRSLMG